MEIQWVSVVITHIKIRSAVQGEILKVGHVSCLAHDVIKSVILTEGIQWKQKWSLAQPWLKEKLL